MSFESTNVQATDGLRLKLLRPMLEILVLVFVEASIYRRVWASARLEREFLAMGLELVAKEQLVD